MDSLASCTPSWELELRRACIDLLARPEHSCVELRRKLSRKFDSGKFDSEYSAEQIDLVIETLAAEGLQSDLRFAESYTRARYNRGDGPYKVKAALQQRGIHKGLVERVLEDEQLDWQRRAKLVYQHKFPESFSSKPPAINSGANNGAANSDGYDNKDEHDKLNRQRAKEMRFLQSRGFPKEMIFAIVG